MARMGTVKKPWLRYGVKSRQWARGGRLWLAVPLDREGAHSQATKVTMHHDAPFYKAKVTEKRAKAEIPAGQERKIPASYFEKSNTVEQQR